METTGLLHHRRFIQTAILMAVLLILIFATEILTSGLPDAPIVTSDIAAVACALAASFLFIRAWKAMSEEEVSKRVWGLVTLGIVLWTLAEAIWGFYELVLKLEIPYPSIADIAWLLGYVPLYMALLLRYRSFESSASALQKRLVLAFIVLYSAALVYYVAIPIVQGFDPSLLSESLTNVAYPLADWGLCVLTLTIIFSLERGRFATVWHLFGLGILLSATADLAYFYADWNDLYYPGGQLNLLSGVIDGIFNLSYLLLGLSIYAYGILAEAARTPGVQITLSPMAKMEVLVFINREGRILSTSDNFMNLVRARSTRAFLEEDLTKALGLGGREARDLMTKLRMRTSLSGEEIHIKDSKGIVKTAWLNSLMILDEDAHPDSIALVLRAEPPEGEQELPLHRDQKMLIDYYLAKGGTSRFEEDEELRKYFLAQINLLLSIIRQYSGGKVADRMLEHLGQAARIHNWQFSHSGQTIHFPEELRGQALSDLLVPLLEEARDFTADVTSQHMVEQEMNSLDKNLSPGTQSILQKYGLRLSARAAGKIPREAAATA